MEIERSPILSDYPNIGTDVSKARYYRKNLDKVLDLGITEFIQESVQKDGLSFHPNVNLYIDVTTECPFDCGFCIAKTTDGRAGILTGSWDMRLKILADFSKKSEKK
jgi:2-iminoacetate synthase ThiH